MSDLIKATRAFFAALNNVRGSFAALFVLLAFAGSADAQRAKRQSVAKISAPSAAALSATLNDTFADTNGDGKASPDETVTYTATLTNTGTTAATNVVYSGAVDKNATYAANSARVSVGEADGSLIYCTFYTNSGGSPAGGTDGVTRAYDETDANLVTRIGGQNEYVNFITSNVGYNAATGVFQFDGALQNLVPNALGTLDGVAFDFDGVQMVVRKITVNSGSGVVTAIDPASFRFDEIIRQDEVSAAKTFQFNVPSTVASFTVGFLVSTRAELKLLINEVMVNPNDPITDANGEWFELYNAGRFRVNLQNFLINDASAAGSPGEDCYDETPGSTKCFRTPFKVDASLPIEPGGYLVFGNTTNTVNNGGVPVDYAYGTAMSLANSLDAIRIRTPEANSKLKIDMIQYAQSVSTKNGISRELKNPALDNAFMDGSNWGDAGVTSVYGQGGRGTPKAENSTYTPYWSGNETTPEKLGSIGNAAHFALLAGETVSVNVGTIPAGESVVVTYTVDIANPLPTGTTEISTQGTISGDNFASVTTDDPATDAANDATVTPVALAPTAAAATISGRVATSTGRGIGDVIVELTDAVGTTRTVKTSAFGYYRFVNVQAGETYVVAARSRTYAFSQSVQVVNVGEDLTDTNFTAYRANRAEVK